MDLDPSTPPREPHRRFLTKCNSTQGDGEVKGGSQLNMKLMKKPAKPNLFTKEPCVFKAMPASDASLERLKMPVANRLADLSAWRCGTCRSPFDWSSWLEILDDCSARQEILDEVQALEMQWEKNMAKKAMTAGGVAIANGAFDAVASIVGLEPKHVKVGTTDYMDLAVGELKRNGSFKLSGLLNMKLQTKLARPAGKGVNPFTQEPCVFKAKPASKTARCLPMKKLKDAVNRARIRILIFCKTDVGL